MLGRRTREEDDGSVASPATKNPVLAPLARPNDRLRGTWPPSTISGVFMPEPMMVSLSSRFSISAGGLSCFENLIIQMMNVMISRLQNRRKFKGTYCDP